MAATSRIDIRLTEVDSKTIADAAVLMGVSTSAFFRNAALEKAVAMFDENKSFVVSLQDFTSLNKAISQGAKPNAAMLTTLSLGAAITRA